MSSKHERSAFLLLIIDMFYFDFTFRSFNHLDVRSEVILINFGFVGFVVGLVSSLILDIDNLKSVLTDGITMELPFNFSTYSNIGHGATDICISNAYEHPISH